MKKYYPLPISRLQLLAILSTLFLTSLHAEVFGAAKNWSGSTSSDWNVAGNWVGGTLPTSVSDIVIDPVNYTGAGADPIISANSSFSVNTIVVQNGAILTIQANLTSASFITINPLVSNTNTLLSMTGGTLTISGTGVGNDFNIDNDGTCNLLGGTINIGHFTNCDHGGVLNISGASLTTLTLKCCHAGIAASVITMTAGLLHTTDANAGGNSVLIDGGGGTNPKISISGGTVIEDGETHFAAAAGDSPQLDISGGTVTLTKIVSNISGGRMVINISGGTTYFQGGISSNSSSDLITQTAGTVELDNTNTWTNSGIYNATGGNLIFNGSTTLSKLASGTWQFNNLTINTAGTFNQNNATDIKVAGNWTQDGGTFIPGTNSVTFNGTSSQVINGTSASKIFYNVILVKPSSSSLVTGGSTTTVTVQNLTMTTGKFTAPATLNINGNLLLTTGTLTAGTTINIKGNWTKNGGSFTPGTGTVSFNGSGTNILAGTSSTTFYNLTLSTVLTGDIVRLMKNTTVTSVLNLIKGVLDLNSMSLSVTNGLAGAILRTSGHILSEKTDNSSKVVWQIGNNSTSHTFPFGTNSGSYIPFILNLTAGNMGNVTVSTYQTSATNTPYPSSPVAVTNLYGATGNNNSANVVDRFWQIDKDGPSGTATLTFTATSTEVGTILLPTAQRYESSTNKWQLPLPGQTNTATSATVPGVTTFSPWALSSQSAILPIQLVSFDAVYTAPAVLLTWVTESELNSDSFFIERTTDESTFETVGRVKAAGQSVKTLTYQTIDNHPLSGVSYYRLKQTDLDGTESYSDLVAIQIATADEISVSPNPVTTGTVTLQIPNHSGETLDVSLINLNGKILFTSKNVVDEGGKSCIVIDQEGNLPKGLYILRVSTASQVFNKKITIN